MPTHDLEEELPPESDEALADRVARLGDRLAAGETISPGQLDASYPSDAAKLEHLFPALRLVGKLKDAETAGDGESTRIASAAEVELDRTLGDFRLIRRIGSGGMGIVYEAEQLSLRRKVAIKVLPSVLAEEPGRQKRFLIEAQAAAALHHPHIVPVHVIGEDRGIHFFAMQLIEGRTLAQVIRLARVGGAVNPPESNDGASRSTPPPQATVLLNAPLPDAVRAGGQIEERSPEMPLRLSPAWVAELGRQAAQALGHAHQQRVIHRDVKPSNLMLDRMGQLWVADFGLARIPGGDKTASGLLAGTFRYMSPEQIAGTGAGIDHRTDLYSLGATLYELLALRPAYPQDDRLELFRAITQRARVPLRQIEPTVPRDLETIVDKAMAGDRDGRYATAEALAEDLARFLAGQPILARPPGWSEHASHWAARNKVFIIAAALIVIGNLLTAGAVLAWRNSFLEAHNRDLSRALTGARAHEQTSRRLLYISQMRLAQAAVSSDHLEYAQEILAGLRPNDGQDDLRGFEWYYLFNRSQRDFSLLSIHHAPIVRLALTSDARTLVTGDQEGNLVFWDMVARRERARVRAHPGTVTGLRSIPGDQLLVSWHSLSQPGEPGEVKIWDLTTASELATLPCECYIPEVHIDEENRRVTFVSWANRHGLSSSFHCFRTETDLRSLRPFDSGLNVTALAYSRDRQTLATADLEGHVELRSPRTFEVLKRLSGLSPQTLGMAISHDTSTLAATGAGRLTLWNLPTGQRLAELNSMRRPKLPYFAFQLRFSNDDRHLLAIDVNRIGLMLIAEPKTRPTPVDVEGLPGELDDADLSPDGRSLFITRRWGAVSLWSVSAGQKRSDLPSRDSSSRCLAFPPKGDSLLVGGEDGRARQWRLQGSSPVELIEGHKGEVWSLTFNPKGDRLISSADDHLIKVWDPRTGELLRTLAGHGSLVSSVAISSDGTRLASAGYDGIVDIWRMPTGEKLFTLKAHEDRVRAVAFAPDGQILASGSSDSTGRIWDVTKGKIRQVVGDQKGGVLALAFDPMGRYVASSCDDGMIRCLDMLTAKLAFCLPAKGRNYAVTFSPDGSRLAAGSEFGTITIWETKRWTRESSIRSSSRSIHSLAFSPDTSRIAAGNEHGMIMLWEAESGELLLELQGHSRRINAVTFSPNGQLLASASHDGSIRLWRADNRCLADRAEAP